MKKEIAELFVKALRSDDYKQVRGRLRINDRFCAGGVLCNLHAQAHPKIASKQENTFSYMGNAYSIPKKVMDWAGMSGHTFIHKGKVRSIIGMNDSEGISFSEIADVIEDAFVKGVK